MERKQINRMLFKENACIGLISTVLGLAIGICVSYIIYLMSIDTRWYSFEVPWTSIIISTLIAILMIILSTRYLKKRVFSDNLISILKSEWRGK